MTITRFLFAVTACMALVACATARLPNQGNIVAPIEMQTYRINLADADDWKAWALSRKTENDTIVLERLRIWPLNGEVQGSVTMMVSRNTVSPEGRSLTKVELADHVRALEEKIMREKGPTEGKYEIQELAKGDIVRNGRKLYTMAWTASRRWHDRGPLKNMAYMKGALYIYFPEVYKDTHAFYEFLITDAVIPPTFFNPDVEQIYPIIDAFSLK